MNIKNIVKRLKQIERQTLPSQVDLGNQILNEELKKATDEELRAILAHDVAADKFYSERVVPRLNKIRQRDPT